ncbi:TonB-dependent receptor plug domain-containing protein [Parapedobacter deserti]|uniref:TonB-dependent receptor plug domain-containing protein n=1 Tax=Parapedobacter deserti TaxID=1912957 RepID=A0ABV7JNR4_9SPHI
MKVPRRSVWILLISLFSASPLAVSAQELLVMDSLVVSNRSGLENTLQGNVAGLRVKSWSGTPGTQAIINIRGLSLDPTDDSTLPLILINGIPIIAGPSPVTAINPLSYYSPEQIERIEVIKSIDQLAAYGVQAPNGAINIVMKEGTAGPLHVRASAFAGANFLSDFNYRKDAFYDFNTIARREVYRSGSMVQEQRVLVDGGGDFGSYLFGLDNHQDKGGFRSATFGRQSLFLNARYNITPKLEAHFYNNLALADRNGRYAGEYDRRLPLSVIDEETAFMDKKRNVALLSTMGLTYRFHPNLSIRSLAGLSYEGASRDTYIPSDILNGNIYASSEAYKRQLITINTSLNYRTSLSDQWKMDMTLGHELRNTDNRLTSVDGGRSLESGGSNFVKVVTGYNANQTEALSDHNVERLLSFFGVWKWDYRDDLQLNLTLRTDGSSLYERKWGLYPALGFSYHLKNAWNVPLTVSASAGKTGVLNRPEAYRGELIGMGDYYNANMLGVGQLYPAFRDAKSADVYQFDAGVSYALTPSLTLSVDYFSKTYQDFAYLRYLPNIQGVDYQYETGAKLGLSGFEFTLDGRWVQTERFSWSTNLNLAAYRNRVKELPQDLANTSLSHLVALGTGDPITSLIAYEGGQQKVVGNSEATRFGGFSNFLSFGNITASFTLTYAAGADVIAESFSSRYAVASIGGAFPLKQAETPYYFMEGDGVNAVYQGIRTIEDGSFIRLSRAAVAYRLGSVLKSSLPLSDAELFVRGDNLLTLSKYGGINPEENVAGIRASDLRHTGTPLPAAIVLGLKLVF